MYHVCNDIHNLLSIIIAHYGFNVIHGRVMIFIGGGVHV